MRVALALALTLAACSSDDDDTHSSADPAAAISHIHGLGLAAERLYVATHQGVYTPTAKGKPELVGDSKDDFMGFTVAADKTFYASGHPSEGGKKGLIKSTDAGQTWTPLSLNGQSDFHALDFAHGTIFGLDATNGLLRTSTDGKSWKDGATPHSTSPCCAHRPHPARREGGPPPAGGAGGAAGRPP